MYCPGYDMFGSDKASGEKRFRDRHRGSKCPAAFTEARFDIHCYLSNATPFPSSLSTPLMSPDGFDLLRLEIGLVSQWLKVSR